MLHIQHPLLGTAGSECGASPTSSAQRHVGWTRVHQRGNTRIPNASNALQLAIADSASLSTADVNAAMLSRIELMPSQKLIEAIANALRSRSPYGQGAGAAKSGGLARWQVRRTLEFMRHNLSRTITSAELATISRLPTDRFCREFRHATGQTPQAAVTRLRMERAGTLLRDTGTPVSQIAIMVGYVTPQAFSSAFARHTGLAPSVYRRQHLLDL